MRHLFLIAMLSILVGPQTRAAFAIGDSSARKTTELTTGWRFYKGDVPGAETEGFNDASWRQVSVPHDWSIEGPFDKDNPSGGAGAFLPGGVSYYRRHISLGKDAGKRVFIEFDGVMAHSSVWLNGKLLGERPNGYVSFGYDLTPYVHFGRDNVLVVKTDTSQQPASRWYEGAGIYRKVRLVVEQPVHVARWGTYLTTPEVTAASAKVRMQVRVANQSKTSASTRVRVRLLSPDGKMAANAVSEPQ